jgi:inosine triphosphate pyrophosphatase
MKQVVYVTGNANKAKYFAKMVGLNIPHIKVDVDEIQSINLNDIVEHKAKQAFELVRKPVIVEDTKLSFNALGGLPGPFIKWFLDELGTEGLCKILNSYDDRSAVAGAAIAYYDGKTLEIFDRELLGTIADEPAGDSEFGWNSVFIPEGSDITLGQMDDTEFRKYYARIKPFDAIADFLKSLDGE